MALETYIRAMPKVALDIRLEGLFRKDTLLIIADQNEIASSTRNFPYWVELLDMPEYDRLEEITESIAGWLQEPDDLTRLVYDAGVILARENVKYAEIVLNPVHTMLPGLAFDEYMAVINDGRERAERGWGIKMRWLLTIPRSEPRRADEIVRWANSPTGKKGHVVGLGLYGPEGEDGSALFQRAFSTADKKAIPTTAQADPAKDAESLVSILDDLHPNRLLDGWGTITAPDVLSRLAQGGIALNVSVARALCHGWVDERAAYPLSELASQVPVVIGTDMPTFYKTSLTEEYIGAVEHNGISLEDLEKIALNAVRHSFLPEEARSKMLAHFRTEYERLRSEHIAPQSSPEAS